MRIILLFSVLCNQMKFVKVKCGEDWLAPPYWLLSSLDLVCCFFFVGVSELQCGVKVKSD